jgi:glycosyltransferase involved in cell wall biosynthesis
VAPFLAEGLPAPPAPAPPAPAPPGPPLRLFYPADGVAHKNHARLLKAMALLAREGVAVRLELTLPPHEVAARLAALALPADLATGTGPIGREAVLARIAEADALIFPSLTESFGLPLLEARAAGTPIIAAERDYVRDVCAPAETFDPLSARSIADAVRRLAGRPRPLAQPTDAAGFVEALFA